MKALEEIKEAYAKEVGAKNWELFINDQPNYMVEPIMDKIAMRCAQKACENLRERIAESAVLLDTSTSGLENLTVFEYEYGHVTVDRGSILNTEITLP